MPFIDNPGMSIIAFDPGGTTGVAVWDAFEQQLFIDQIDAGRGRKVRLHVWPKKVESPRRERTKRAITGAGGDAGPGRGVENEMEILDQTEAGVAQVMIDLTLACGPRTIIVVEDFILGHGGATVIRSGAREGVSPIRIRTRFRQKCEDMGILNGDAWRNWDGFGATGSDARGIKVVRSATQLPMNYLERLTDAERYRLGDPAEDVGTAERGLWAGTGAKWVNQMPGSRFLFPRPGKGEAEKAMREWLKEEPRNQWMASAPHGMDALMHLHVMARRLGSNVHGRGNRIWVGGETLKSNRLTTKAASPSRLGPLL